MRRGTHDTAIMILRNPFNNFVTPYSAINLARVFNIALPFFVSTTSISGSLPNPQAEISFFVRDFQKYDILIFDLEKHGGRYGL